MIKQRTSKGQFMVTTGSTKYKMKQKNGKRKAEHVLIWEDYHKMEVPKGYHIHHKDRNTKNNSIDNLEMKEKKKHGADHFKEYFENHSVWNKGIKAPQISESKMGHEVSNKQIMKDKITWFVKNLDCNISIWKLKDSGKTFEEIAQQLNLTKGQVVARWRGFCKAYLIPFGEVLK